jgi:hypothetical protein
MGQVDITDLLADSDFVDPVTLIHRTPHVNEYGENRLKEQGFSIVGSVQPIDGETLARLPDALRVADIMHFWIRGRIVADGSAQYPDILVHNGKRYAVQILFDWTSWGDGWCEGTCAREKPSIG